jgi:hypothetical protein
MNTKPREAQMGHFYPPVLEEDVCRLKVSVGHVELVEGGNPQQDLLEDPESLGLRETAAGANIIS